MVVSKEYYLGVTLYCGRNLVRLNEKVWHGIFIIIINIDTTRDVTATSCVWTVVSGHQLSLDIPLDNNCDIIYK